jgi:long-chain acyl-CoA synthetase
MTNEQTILLTGATGLLGSELLHEVLKRENNARVLVLMRGEPEAAQARFRSLMQDPFLSIRAKRIELVVGNLLEPNLGLEPQTRAALAERITHVVHAAASISFDLPYAQAHAINCGGTERVCALAAESKHLQAFAHISTAYVAGRRKGIITEDQLDHDAGFVNTYEHTKYESEQFLRAQMSRLPIAIYRTTTMIGASATGVVRQFNYVHAALRALYLGRVPFIPGDPQYRVDVIPHDWAAQVIRTLALERFRAGETYHICSGPEHSFSLAELLRVTCDAFGGSVRPPSILPADEFQRILERAQRTNGRYGKATGLPKQFQYFVGEFAHPKIFDASHLNRDLPAPGEQVPDVRTYYVKVLEFCLANHWGVRRLAKNQNAVLPDINLG